MHTYRLADIAELAQGSYTGNPDATIEHIVYDSRKLLSPENTLFVAIKGLRHNGHSYIPYLYKKGIRNFLISEFHESFQALGDANFCSVKNTLYALQALAAHQRNLYKTNVLGITGSNGKTIVKEWIAQILDSEISITKSPKSYNSQLGVALSLFLLNEKTELGIIEAGISEPNEMSLLEVMITPNIGILTNIGEAHQENFSSYEEKIREKLSLFIHTSHLLYCADQELIHQSIQKDERLKNCTKISWSVKPNLGNYQITPTNRLENSTELNISSDRHNFTVSLPFTDKASIENASHTICFLMYYGVSTELISRKIPTLAPVAMRLEQVRGINNCTIINDSYNSDLNSLAIALDYLNLQKYPTRSVILSDILQNGTSDETLYAEVSKLIKKSKIRELICIGPRISKQKDLFHGINAYFYLSTTEFLKGLYINGFQNEAILVKGARSFLFEDIVGIISEQIHTTTLEISLHKLVSNLNYFRGLLKPETKIMVMAKALAYGSGTKEIANILQFEKIDYLGVAFADEGVALREAGISLPILVLSPTPESYRKIIEYELEPEIYGFSMLNQFSKALQSSQASTYGIHIKIDTGMHRLGFMPEQIPELINTLKKSPNIHVQGIFSHLAASGNPNEDNFTQMQLDTFNQICNTICIELGISPIRHIANSSAIERFPESHFEMVRLGIGLHGISSLNTKLEQVSTLKTIISQIKTIPAGHTIGYNRREVVTKSMKLAILPIGYADGLDRKFGNRKGEVFLHGKFAKIVGDVCMDMIMIDISKIDAKEGDEVIIFGSENPIEKLAKEIDTIPYEILTNVSSRVKRLYLNE